MLEIVSIVDLVGQVPQPDRKINYKRRMAKRKKIILIIFYSIAIFVCIVAGYAVTLF